MALGFDLELRVCSVYLESAARQTGYRCEGLKMTFKVERMGERMTSRTAVCLSVERTRSKNEVHGGEGEV